MAFAGAWYRLGQVTVTQGRQTVTGLNTQWQSDLLSIAPGDIFSTDFTTWYEIVAVTSHTGLVLDRAFAGETGTVDYGIIRSMSGTTNTRLAGLITRQFQQKQRLLDEWQVWVQSERTTEPFHDSYGKRRSFLTLSQFDKRAKAAIAVAQSASETLSTLEQEARTAKTLAQQARELASDATGTVQRAQTLAKQYAIHPKNAVIPGTQDYSALHYEAAARLHMQAAEGYQQTAATQARSAQTHAGNAKAAATQADSAKTLTLGYRNEAKGYRDQAKAAATSVTGGLSFGGDFDASSGQPPVTPSAGSVFYKVTLAGQIEGIDYDINDAIVYHPEKKTWFKLDNTEQIASVNGMRGRVVLSARDVGAAALQHTHPYQPQSPALDAVVANTGRYGSVQINGAKGGYAGLYFPGGSRYLMVHPNHQGIYTGGAWQWRFYNGALANGTVPWSRLTAIPQTASRWPTAAEAKALPVSGTAVNAAKLDNTSKSSLLAQARAGLLTTSGKAADASRLEGRTKAQLLSDARQGMLPNNGRGSTLYLSNWFRSTGTTGWYSQTYGGGMYMLDYTWVRTYGGKKFFVYNAASDAIYTTGGLRATAGVRTNLINLVDGKSQLSQSTNSSIRLKTPYGSVDIGPRNSLYCHFVTDRGSHWFNKTVKVAGELYCGSSYNYRVYHQGYKPSAADVGALPKGSRAADAAKLASYSPSMSPVANTAALRNSAADLQARLFRSHYPNEQRMTGGVAFRVNTKDNYIRYCANPTAFMGWMQKALDSRYALRFNNDPIMSERGCFALGTLIMLADGTPTAIESLRPGDRIAAYHHPALADSSSAGWQQSTLTNVADGKLTTTTVASLHLSRFDNYYLLNGQLKVTFEHPFLVRSERFGAGSDWRWLTAEHVAKGDTMMAPDGKAIAITDVQFIQQPLCTANINVEPDDNYFVALAGEFVLAHNAEKP